MRLHRFAAPALGLTALCGLAACDSADRMFSVGKTERPLSENAAHGRFAQRPSPTERLDAAGVTKAFMVEAPQTGVNLGWGWSADRDQAIPTRCVEFDTLKDPAQETRVSVQEVRDSQELASAMDISAAVQVKTVGFEGSGKAKFAQDTQISSFSTTLVIKAEVRNGAEYAAPKAALKGHAGPAVVLTEDAAALARRNLDVFRATCGEGFVSARMTGAEAFAVIDFQTRTARQRETAETSASGSGWGVKVDGAFSAANSSDSTAGKSSISFYQAGGSGKDLPQDADAIKSRIKDLAKDAVSAGKTYALQITPYQVLENFPRGVELTADAGETDEIAQSWGLYRTVYDDIGTVFATPADFELPVAICSTDAKTVSDCTVEFKPVSSKKIGDGVDVSTLDMLGALQDIALVSLDRIELGAQQCLAADASCNFDPATLRSSYAARAGLPLPTKWLGDTATDQDKRDAQLAFQLRDAARGRCAISSLAQGCISNAEIAGWAARTGFVPLAAASKAAFDRAVAALKGKTPFFTGDANAPTAWTLWVPPAHLHAAQAALAGAAVAKL